jgi:hypothetical protein
LDKIHAGAIFSRREVALTGSYAFYKVRALSASRPQVIDDINRRAKVAAVKSGAISRALSEEWCDQSAYKVGKPSVMQQSMLDFAENVKEDSRLSCQIKVRDDLDGLKVTTPESQHQRWFQLHSKT